ncbi:PEP-CTERM sorting domain-containing protein [Symplocastrum sp. BBK-W-15]|uniref:PEP-CTERM sorting domain-containing protein n=1 Tax=Limnofasciculus baicalensis BBK-W-15 TaxID=2699891 RepID=A0AAE3GRW2_9CYAN|nr:PEP-CTERM sorting domain-containing protein [Limnofasciculus baicalensis]MCP2728832.1 PEP-CTERM sorting domain-containing protein [Limnofasciculus baicalensis BBK-W-15]
MFLHVTLYGFIWLYMAFLGLAGKILIVYALLGNNAILSSVNNAIDGNLLTTTTMGNTIGQDRRLSITLGFTAIPEPSSTLSLLALGTLGAASTLKRKLKTSKYPEKEPTKVG